MMRALALLALLPGPALAAGFVPPPGCETYMTVQSRQCRVSNHFRCASDPAGDQWRMDADQEGPYFFSRINSEAEWVESYGMERGSAQRLGDRKDPASFSDLLANGVDRYDFRLEHEDGAQSHVQGHDSLTGKSTVIDGIALQETEFDFTETDSDGNVIRRSRGREYISPEMRMFFSGPSEFLDADGNWVPFDGRPVQFIFPGEKGFAATQPIFDCDAILSQLQPSGGPA